MGSSAVHLHPTHDIFDNHTKQVATGVTQMQQHRYCCRKQCKPMSFALHKLKLSWQSQSGQSKAVKRPFELPNGHALYNKAESDRVKVLKLVSDVGLHCLPPQKMSHLVEGVAVPFVSTGKCMHAS